MVGIEAWLRTVEEWQTTIARKPGTSPLQRATLLDQLMAAFDMKELQVLAFKLGVNTEDIAGETVSEFAKGLIEYFERRDRLYVLVDYCQRQRPNHDWDGFG